MDSAPVTCNLELCSEAHAPGCCPHCGGTLLPLGGQMRCTRCYFTLCVNCEEAREARIEIVWGSP